MIGENKNLKRNKDAMSGNPKSQISSYAKESAMDQGFVPGSKGGNDYVQREVLPFVQERHSDNYNIGYNPMSNQWTVQKK
jgi:hypothetical protein